MVKVEKKDKKRQLIIKKHYIFFKPIPVFRYSPRYKSLFSILATGASCGRSVIPNIHIK
jgi:hypothetical protein